MSKKCDCCGKFRKEEDLAMMQAEGDETWLECKLCCSQADYDMYFKKDEE